MTRRLAITALGSALLCLGCKVPLSDINASFSIADVSWFEAEETLFVFYELEAEQGLGEESVLEIRYTTDEGAVKWTELSALTQVHVHVATECEGARRCGSGSLHVPKPPRDVAVRLRYHREGELALDSETVLNIVDEGPAHSHRSFLVYGVFDEANEAIQWRGRHQFPTIRNQEAERLGLRRPFTVEGRVFGAEELLSEDNPYLYGVECPQDFASLGELRLGTDDRAVFEREDLPDRARDAATVCALSTVLDGTGFFEATAVARKNPEVQPAFPVLRSPVRDATPIKYLLQVCDRSISRAHLKMQKQRLFLDGVEPVCIDDWMEEDFADTLVARFREDVETTRADGSDMVLSIAVHHDTPEIGVVIEAALLRILATERDRATPRLAGAFVLDSYGYGIEETDVSRNTMWCPSLPPEEASDVEDVSDAASLGCVILPDTPNLSFGPFDVGALPILPSREMFLDFIDIYSEAQAGEMKSLTYRVPERPPSSEHIDIQPLGFATFFNGEVITAGPKEAFSYCETDEYEGFVFRAPSVQVPLPIAVLPDLHLAAPLDTYDLGIVWDFPFLLRMEYEVVGALAVSAFGASVPVGFGVDLEQDFGSSLWGAEEFSLAETLKQCHRFCDHPTFDSAGVFQVTADFRTAYKTACYAPRFPTRFDSTRSRGFPIDP